MKSLSFFADQSKNPVFEGFATVVNYALPDLEKFNWRALVIYQEESLPFKSFVVANLYALLWFVFLIGLTSFVLRRKDFG